jgi:outer membrane protein assembly factor BamB
MKNTFLLVLWMAFVSVRLCLGQPAGTLLWSYSADSTITTSPALASDGTIYLGTGNGLYAITNAGSNKWTFPTPVASSPAIASDGTIYFCSQDGNLYVVNPNGSQKWSYPMEGGSGSPAIGPDNTIYVSGGFKLHAVTPAGINKWKSGIGDSGVSSPAVGPDGTIYVGGWDLVKFYAFDPMGNQKWVFNPSSSPSDSPAFGADGTIYLVGGLLYALSPEGTNLWTNTTNNFYGSSPAIGRDGTIYVENPDDNSLWSLKSNGETNWSIATGPVFHGPLPTPPAIDSSGMLYYSASNTLFAVTPQGSISWIFAPDHSISSVSPCIGPDGTVYAAFGSTLYALKGTNALGSTPWPMYRQNLRHTGKVEKPALQAPKKRADANFQFQLAGEVGQTYTIQRSADLSLWSTFTNLVATNPPATFVDLSASNFNSNFYRAVLQ